MNLLCSTLLCLSLAAKWGVEVVPEDIPYTQEEIEMVADIVMNEASTEPFECKQAIAKVIFNRLEYGTYGSTLEDVINAPGAFCVSNNNGDTTDECIEATIAAAMYPNCFPSDMLYFRNEHYHNFGYEYCKFGNTYFSTRDLDHNKIPEGNVNYVY